MRRENFTSIALKDYAKMHNARDEVANTIFGL